jgi:NSS family neurotransmitter:Na+ symporter
MGFILAAAGSAIGLGNLWKFPYVTYENGYQMIDGVKHEHGAGTFILVYIACIILVGLPIMMAEILVGRKTQLSPVGAFGKLGEDRPGGRSWSLLGFMGVLAGFIILSYYSVVAGWTIHYTFLSLKGELAQLATNWEQLDSYFGNEFLASGGSQLFYHVLFMALTTGAVFFGVKVASSAWPRSSCPVCSPSSF